MMGRHYRYCGLILDSEIELPELPALPLQPPAGADLAIRIAAVPFALEDAVERTETYEHNGREAIWRLRGVGRYRVCAGGQRIEVQAEARADAASVRLFLLHPVFALAAVLRGDWLLNAAAVERDGQVSAFIGPPGCGKSTAAAVLLQRGWRLVSDSLLRVGFDPVGGVLAYPQASWVCLWPGAAEQLGLNPEEMEPLRAGIALRRVYHPTTPAPLPLTRVGILREQNGGDLELFASNSRHGRHAFEALLHHVVGHTWLDAFGQRRGLFFWGTRIAAGAAIEKLELPWGWEQVGALGANLEDWCRMKGPLRRSGRSGG